MIACTNGMVGMQQERSKQNVITPLLMHQKWYLQIGKVMVNANQTGQMAYYVVG